LRTLGESRVLKTSYLWFLLVPISARLLSSIDSVVNLRVFGTPFTITLGLPFSWEILFFGSLFVSAANLIFVVLCPQFVRDFEQYPEYTNSGRTVYNLAFSAIDVIDRTPAKARKQTVAYYRDLAQIPSHLASDLERREPARQAFELRHQIPIERAADVFWFVHDSYDEQRRVARFLCTAFYGVGLCCIAFVAAQNVLYVLKVADLK